MKEFSIQDLFDHMVHFGHRKTKWNPKMKKYIFAEKDGVHVLDLEKTKESLDKALAFLKVSASEGKQILFVGTKPQVRPMTKALATELGMPFVDVKWPAGLLTNWDVFKTRISYMKQLKDDIESGDLEEKYTKKEVARFRKECAQLVASLGGVEHMRGIPDIIFVVDPYKEQLVVKEAAVCKVPVVAIVDTNASPEDIDYIIPANDDARQSLGFILGLVRDVCSVSAKKPQETVKKM